MEEIYVLGDLLNTLIELEIKGCHLYQKFEKRVEDAELQRVFHELAAAEKNHELYYKNLNQTNAAGMDVQLDVDDEYKSYLHGLIENHFFVGSDDFEARTLEEVMDIAESLEKETILFLNELQGIIYESVDLQNILNEEKTHLLRIYQYRKSHQRP